MPGIAASLSPSNAKLDGWKLSRIGSGFVCVLSPMVLSVDLAKYDIE
jgi:hypothetical protein